MSSQTIFCWLHLTNKVKKLVSYEDEKKQTKNFVSKSYIHIQIYVSTDNMHEKLNGNKKLIV